jgi:hypothetical protein
MIKIENTKVVGWEEAIRGMRNPMNSWDRADSIFCRRGECEFCPTKTDCGSKDLDFDIGPKDYKLMTKLAKAGSVHAKYRRMITVYLDITAPLYFWKEFDTYKVGTVANSCSTMHKIAEKEFTLDDFSCEHLIDERFEASNHIRSEIIPFGAEQMFTTSPQAILQTLCNILNDCRELFLETKDKKYWWQMIQLLPSSYNQRRTVMLNYEVLAGIYIYRRNHKLDEWHNFCEWIEKLPYSELITCGVENVEDDE